MTTIATTTARGAALAALLAATATIAAAQDWRAWNIHPEDYPNSVAIDAFAAAVEEGTEGRVTVEVFHNGVLGSQPDAIDQMRAGALEAGNFNMGPMGPVVPAANVLSLPFLFASIDQMHEAMDGEIGGRFAEAMEAEGIVALSWFDSGSRSFYNTRGPIETPADLDGMKFRVMNNDLYVDMVDALGGNATPMAYGEVFQSLRTGVIDGAENNYPSFESSNHYEVAKYYSITDHLILPECLCVSKSAWDALSAEDQEVVRRAAQDAAQEQRALWAERSEASRAKVEEAGVAVNEVADKAPFQEAMGTVYDGFIEQNPEFEELLSDIQAMSADAG